ncbi:MarR family transcriptional regulator [Streptomyces sp. NPDC048641]|uniref:MarR family transcriptional regulator n=1 Tax=Streptomyces sp. NPDC048641 TaxID=3154825 RepID=UPI003429677D
MDREGQGDPRHELAEETAAAVETLASLWWRASQEVSPRLSALQLDALLITRRNPGINLTGLAVAVGAAPPAVSRLCDRLEAAGLLRREASPTSRREIELALTPRGHKIIDSLFARRSELLGNVLGRMAASSQRELQAFSEAVRAGRLDGSELS